MVGHGSETGRGLDASVCLFRDDRERERFLKQLGDGTALPRRPLGAPFCEEEE
jgi:hypothetical protein